VRAGALLGTRNGRGSNDGGTSSGRPRGGKKKGCLKRNRSVEEGKRASGIRLGREGGGTCRDWPKNGKPRGEKKRLYENGGGGAVGELILKNKWIAEK